MISFPNAKINLGLYITGKREDGFHSLETIMVPIPLADSLELIDSKEFEIELNGIKLDGQEDDNLVVKAFKLMRERYQLSPVKILLDKKIPFGAGLGGGSADAAFFIKMLNDHFNLGLIDEDMEEIAAELGSDCPFFIKNNPVFANGRGELLHEININLKGLYLLLVKPPFEISTKEAYSSVVPSKMRMSLKGMIDFPINQWKSTIKNQFEKNIFLQYPDLEKIKKQLYDSGAIYASMTGSGSTMYALFRSNTARLKNDFPDDYFVFTSRF